MGRIIDLAGQRFGRLVALERVGIDKHGKALWLCSCDCGSRVVINANALRRGRSKSCGCARHAPGYVANLSGVTFGDLTVIAPAGTDGHHHRTWLCRCSCGREVVVGDSHLRRGDTRSCGCAKSTRTGVHGDSSRSSPFLPLYAAWSNMLRRCEYEADVGWKHYGGRGVSVCEDWHRYESFKEWALVAGWRAGLTIDRIDVNGGYEPSNCRWVSMYVQSRNRRDNVWFNLLGTPVVQDDLATMIGVDKSNFQKKVKAIGVDAATRWAVDRLCERLFSVWNIVFA